MSKLSIASKLILTTLLTVGFQAVTPSVFAQSIPNASAAHPAQMNPAEPQRGGNSRSEHEKEGHGFQNMIQKLDLSPEQSQKVNLIMQRGKQQGQALHQTIRKKRQDLMRYLHAPDSTESQAMAMNSEINAMQRQMSELRLKTWFAMRAIMTPEQRQKLQKLRASGLKHHNEHKTEGESGQGRALSEQNDAFGSPP